MLLTAFTATSVSFCFVGRYIIILVYPLSTVVESNALRLSAITLLSVQAAHILSTLVVERGIEGCSTY